MPNWVRSKITIEAENADEIIKNLLTKDENDELQVDFNKIVPMPESLNIISGTLTATCVNLYLNSIKKTEDFRKYITISVLNDMNFINRDNDDFEEEMQDCLNYKDFNSKEPKFKTKEDVLAYGKQALDNLLNYGAIDWYDWRVKHWGTKWNADCTQIDGNTIKFETAWDPVCYLFGEYSKRYPDATFYYEYAEEQINQFCGQITIKNGAFVEENYYEAGSEDALNFGLTLYPECKSYFKYDRKRKKYTLKNDVME